MIGNFYNHEYHCVQILREIQLMRVLNAIQGSSGHVPQLLDLIISKESDDKDMRIFMVQEYFEYDLRTLVMQNFSEITPMHVVSIVYQILCALKFLHSAGVIHRDIKPSNIFITKNFRVAIGDFGISRSLPKPILGPGSCNTKRLRDSFLKYKHEKNCSVQDNLNLLICQKVMQNTAIMREKPRHLSDKTGTRWYRAPELILI